MRAVPAGGSSYQGRIIQSVQFQGVSLTNEAGEHLHQLAVKPGEPLNRRTLADSVRSLYATGRFADLAVEAEAHGSDGVDLVYRATPNYFVGVVTATGAPGLPATHSLRMPRGCAWESFIPAAPGSRNAIDERRIAGERLLPADHYSAGVPRFQYAASRASLSGRARPPAKVGDVIIQGDAGYPSTQIQDVAHLHQGDTVTADRTSHALERLRNRYSHEDRLEAQIALTDRKFHPDSNTLDYFFRIARGPTVNIDVLGADVSQRKLRQLVPVFTEHALDDDLLNEGRRNLREYFQTQGYFDADVTFRRELSNGHLRVVYMVERGERHELVNVEIDGNQYFNSGLIRERMQIKEASWLTSYGHFSQELLDQDVQSILDLYRSNGFQNVKVDTQIKDDLGGLPGRMEVDVNIDEGPQTRVASLKIEGTEKVQAEDLIPLLTTAEGQPYSSTNVATDRDLIMNYYFNRGFSQVSFEASATPEADNPQLVNVVYRLKEGEQVFVDRILMSGLDNTKPGVAERQFQFESGDPLSQTAMLETQRRLYDLGVFNEVKLAVQNSEGDAKYKNILLQFTEARRWTFNYGVGVEIQSGAFGARTDPNGQTGASPTVSFDVSRLNVGGRAHTLSFKSHVGRLQQQGLATYDAPRLFNQQNLRLTFNLFYDNSLNVRTFTSQRMESSIQLEQVLSRISTLLYRFTYRRVQASELQIDPAAIPLLSRPVRVGLPSISYIRDKRDDPIETRNGNYTTVDAGVASSVFGSEASFGRLLVQNSTYHPFRSRRWVFARYTEIGIAKPFGAATGNDPTAQPVIPLPERFFAGGANGLRGFALNQAGPRDLLTGQVLGGEAVFVNSLELRTPPLELPYVGDNLSFAFFHDAGNVFSTVRDMASSLVRWVQKDRDLCTVEATSSECDFAYLSHALGMGIRYRTPIGPVRLDVGYNLNPPTYPYYDDPTTRTGFHSARTGRLQFSFSVGQTF